MKILNRIIMLFLCLGFYSANTHAIDALTEIRYCHVSPYDTIKRDKNGAILRRADVIKAFKKAHPCPITHLSTGSCPGWSIDHVLPLARGGCDAVFNMQWLKNEIKSCAGTLCKDRWELSVY